MGDSFYLWILLSKGTKSPDAPLKLLRYDQYLVQVFKALKWVSAASMQLSEALIGSHRASVGPKTTHISLSNVFSNCGNGTSLDNEVPPSLS